MGADAFVTFTPAGSLVALYQNSSSSDLMQAVRPAGSNVFSISRVDGAGSTGFFPMLIFEPTGQGVLTYGRIAFDALGIPSYEIVMTPWQEP